MWDKDGIYLLVFDDISETEVAKVIVKNLQEGIPDTRKVSGFPDFLSKEDIFK